MLTTNENPTLYDAINLYGEDWAATMSDYPIWDEDKREWLNGMIYEHFQYRRLACETSAYSLFLIRRTMREVMISINPVFKVLDEERDILSGYDTQTDVQNTGRAVFSSTPQTQLSGKENYATSLNDTTEGSLTRNKGRSSTIGDMITNWTTSVNNALMLVYNELEPCFLQLF